MTLDLICYIFLHNRHHRVFLVCAALTVMVITVLLSKPLNHHQNNDQIHSQAPKYIQEGPHSPGILRS